MAGDNRVIFDNLSRKLGSLAYVKSKNDKILLGNLLEEFNSLNYNDSMKIINERAVLVINQCCFLVSHDEIQLISKVLYLFRNLLTKLHVSVEGKTLTVASDWVLECLKIKEQTMPALVVLQALVRGKGHLLGDKVPDSIKRLLNEKNSEDNGEIYINCLNCIEALAYLDENTEIPPDLVNKCCDIFLNFLYGHKSLTSPIWYCKCIITALRGLGNLVGKDATPINAFLQQIFGAIKSYMLYGIPGQECYKIEKVTPSNIALPDDYKKSPAVKKAMGKYDRKSKKKTPTPLSNVLNEDVQRDVNSYVGTSENRIIQEAITSDSDFSDCESGLGAINPLQTKVRRCSFILLGSLLQKGETKNMTRYLTSFLPDGTSLGRNLGTCLLKESSASCRSEILVVLSIILTRFKQFFALADSLTSSSFTTISNNIGEIIKSLHSVLGEALRNENYKIVTTHILKTISDLVRCSPYHKLQAGILTKLATEIVPGLKKKDVNIQIASFVVFGCISSIEPKIEEVKSIIFGKFCDRIPESTERPWLFDQCTKMLRDPNGCNPALALECLQVLAALTRNFSYETVVCYPEEVITILEFTSPKYDFLMRLYAAKYLEATVHALQASVTCEDASRRAPVCVASRVWSEIIFGPMTSLIQCEDQLSLRSAGCDCLANVAVTTENSVNSLIFDELPRSHQIACITHLFGCAKDEAPQVRSSAIRALAVFVQFPNLRNDSLFFLDAVDVFFAAAQDENLGVRLQAAWLFGHIAEAIVGNRNDGEDDIADIMLIKLLNTGVRLAHDVKKGKPYAVRGIANLLTVVSESQVSQHKDDVTKAVDSLVHNAEHGNYMKARWNACYALGNALSNPTICAEARNRSFPILFDLLQNYKNFKVRISAGHALSSLPNRESYGDLYFQTWRALLSGLENAETMVDFCEYQHRDHLVDEICSAMCWLVSLLQPNDLVPLHDLLIHHLEPLSQQFRRFKNRIVPEKGNMITSADSRLAELVTLETLSREQKHCLSLLCGTFLSDPV